jgi:hypothetical protein
MVRKGLKVRVRVIKGNRLGNRGFGKISKPLTISCKIFKTYK